MATGKQPFDSIEDGIELTQYNSSPLPGRRRVTTTEASSLQSDQDSSVPFDELVVQESSPSTPTPSLSDEQQRPSSTESTDGGNKWRLKLPDKRDLTPKLVRAVFDSPLVASRSSKPSSSSGTGGTRSPDSSPLPPNLRSVMANPSEQITSIDVAGKGEVKLKTVEGGQYSVTPTDASLIGRIAHKAPKRSNRVLQPQQVFVELEELRCNEDKLSSSDGLEWEETARWIKFEEDIEEDTGRWGRPHVSALAFHSMVDLRRGLENGLIMLDASGDNFPDIVDKMVDQLVETGQLKENEVEFVLQALYKKHKHQHQITLWDDLKKAAKSADGTIQHIGDQIRQRHSFSIHSINSTDHIDTNNGVTRTRRGGSMKSALLTPSSPDDTTTTEVHEVKFALEDIEESVDGDNNYAFSNPIGHNVDQSEQPSKDLPRLKHSRPSAASMMTNNDDNKRKPSRSVQELLANIPQHAESLTVLVGGVNFLSNTVVAFVRLEQSHLLGDLTEVPLPVRFIYLMLGPTDAVDYHEVGRAMATLMSDKCFHDIAYSAQSSDELLNGMDKFLEDSLVLPPGDWDQELLLPVMHKRNDLRRRREKKLEELEHRHHEGGEGHGDPLMFTRRPGLGILRDIKTLIKRYPRDYTDVLHIQPIIAILFIYISCVAPAIAFGGLMDEVTEHQIGVTETLVGTGACGILYGLLAVQPLTITAFTGPLLLFEEIVIEFAHMLHIDYLAWKACIGLWLMLFILVFSISELSFLIRRFTRFSEEIFTSVIALFFTVEAFRTIIKIYRRNPICGASYPCGDYAHCTDLCDCSNTSGMPEDNYYNKTDQGLPHAFIVCNQVNTALWSTLLCIGTFLIAMLLRKFRQSRFLGKQARRLVSDFGMLTAIATMVTVSYLLRETITVETLFALGWRVSNPAVRGWIINPLNNLEWFYVVGAVIPAALLGVLICIENQLTLLLVNRHDHHLVKGVGYHFDLFLVGLFAGICGVFGLPWICAAPVRSIQHVQALSKYTSKNVPGEKAKLKGVHEQRVTNIAVHIIIFLSPFAHRLLTEIPFAVIIGVFFYLAYASMSGIQLRKRLKLFFTPPKHHPDIHYVRKVKTWKMNLFTAIQGVTVLLLYSLKLSPAGMAYPLAIVLLIPLRMLMGRYIFTEVEMEALNSEEDFPEEEEDNDFHEYQQSHVPY